MIEVKIVGEVFMKLYYSKGACSLAVRIILNELGIESDYEAVDLKAKKTETGADYLKINPKGAVPTLETDNLGILTENLTIQLHLAEQTKNHLLPDSNDPRRYRILEWSTFITTDLHKGCGPLFSPEVPEEIKESIFRPIIKKKLAFVDKSLGDKKFLMGDDFTLPDPYLFVILSWMPHLGVDYSDLKNLTGYFERVKAHPSVAKSLQQEKNATAQ